MVDSRTYGLDQDAVRVTLRQGRNTILVKVCNERWHWKFNLRLTNPKGNPLVGVTF